MTENVTYYEKHVSSRKCLFCRVMSLYAGYATNKCNKPLGSILPLSNARAGQGVLQSDLLSYQALWHPGSKKPERPVF